MPKLLREVRKGNMSTLSSMVIRPNKKKLSHSESFREFGAEPGMVRLAISVASCRRVEWANPVRLALTLRFHPVHLAGVEIVNPGHNSDTLGRLPKTAFFANLLRHKTSVLSHGQVHGVPILSFD